MANFLNFEKSITHYVNKFFHEFESRQLENFLNFLAKNVIEYARLLLDYYSIHSQSNWPVIFAFRGENSSFLWCFTIPLIGITKQALNLSVNSNPDVGVVKWQRRAPKPMLVWEFGLTISGSRAGDACLRRSRDRFLHDETKGTPLLTNYRGRIYRVVRVSNFARFSRTTYLIPKMNLTE